VKKGTTIASSEYLGEPERNTDRCDGTTPNCRIRISRLRESSVASKQKITRFSPIKK
jgi:hypothetical protein